MHLQTEILSLGCSAGWYLKLLSVHKNSGLMDMQASQPGHLLAPNAF